MRGVCRAASSGMLQGINDRNRIQWFGPSARYVAPADQWRFADPRVVVSMNICGSPAATMDVLDDRPMQLLTDYVDDLAITEFLLPEAVGDSVREPRDTVHVLPTTEARFGETYPEDRIRRRGNPATDRCRADLAGLVADPVILTSHARLPVTSFGRAVNTQSNQLFASVS